MPLLPPKPESLLVVYYQTHHFPDGKPRTILPLIEQTDISVSHVIIAAIHLNDLPGNITLNDHEPSHPRYKPLWADVQALQVSGIKVLGMLGGAAQGSYTRLDLDEVTFESYYTPLKDFIRDKKLDGLDLDVEEGMTLQGVIRLIDRLRADFGKKFLITLAPVATALLSDEAKFNLSGFSYEALEVMRGDQIAWYNTQFYCGWGDMSNTERFDQIMNFGYPANKVVIGLVTNPENGIGWVELDVFEKVWILLKTKYPDLGGVMGWEYFNSLPGDQKKPWEWATHMTRILRRSTSKTRLVKVSGLPGTSRQQSIFEDDSCNNNDDAPVPMEFVYYSDNND